MSWCSDAPEDEVISLFAGLLANPDVPLSLYVKGLLLLVPPRTPHSSGYDFIHMRSMLLCVICLLHVYVCYMFLYVICL